MPFPVQRSIAVLALVVAVVSACAGSAASLAPASQLPAASPAATVAPAPTLTPTASPSPTPVPTASPSPMPSVAADPTPAPAVPATTASKAALDGFMKAIAAKKRSFHLHQVASVALDGVLAANAAYDIDVVDRDVSAVVAVSGQDLLFVVIGDKMWSKSGSDAWRQGPRDDGALTDILDVFRYLGDPKELVYVGPVVAGGEPGHAFRISKPLPYQTGAMKASGVVGSVTGLDLWLSADGIPRVIKMRTIVDVKNAAGVVQHASTNSVIDFTRWGEKITISPPE